MVLRLIPLERRNTLAVMAVHRHTKKMIRWAVEVAAVAQELELMVSTDLMVAERPELPVEQLRMVAEMVGLGEMPE